MSQFLHGKEVITFLDSFRHPKTPRPFPSESNLGSDLSHIKGARTMERKLSNGDSRMLTWPSASAPTEIYRPRPTYHDIAEDCMQIFKVLHYIFNRSDLEDGIGGLPPVINSKFSIILIHGTIKGYFPNRN